MIFSDKPYGLSENVGHTPHTPTKLRLSLKKKNGGSAMENTKTFDKSGLEFINDTGELVEEGCCFVNG